MARGVKERKTPARGVFTPSGMSAKRRHSEAQREFRALRSATRALPLTCKLLKKFDQNFNLKIILKRK